MGGRWPVACDTDALTPAVHVVREILEAGACGCLTKECAGPELVAAIRTVMQGKVYLSPRLVDLLVSGYARALSYFRPDPGLVLLWMLLIGAATAVGLLAAWPMAILVDSVLSPSPAAPDWIHRLFLGLLPSTRLEQIVGLAVIGLALKLTIDLLSAAQSVVSNQVNYNGLMRVRCDLYRKLQALNLG